MDLMNKAFGPAGLLTDTPPGQGGSSMAPEWCSPGLRHAQQSRPADLAKMRRLRPRSGRMAVVATAGSAHA